MSQRMFDFIDTLKMARSAAIDIVLDVERSYFVVRSVHGSTRLEYTDLTNAKQAFDIVNKGSESLICAKSPLKAAFRENPPQEDRDVVVGMMPPGLKLVMRFHAPSNFKQTIFIENGGLSANRPRKISIACTGGQSALIFVDGSPSTFTTIPVGGPSSTIPAKIVEVQAAAHGFTEGQFWVG